MNSTLPQYVDIRQNRRGQDRAYVAGTRVRVQDIVIDHERFGLSAEEIVRAYPQLTLAQVHAALVFYFEDRQAIWDCVREDEVYVHLMKNLQDSNGTSHGAPPPHADGA